MNTLGSRSESASVDSARSAGPVLEMPNRETAASMGESGREEATNGQESRRDGLGGREVTVPGYSDWAAAMQVYYKTGPHPPPPGYYPGHVAPPPYVWGPQPVMPPYGPPPPPPHAYFHGGVYHHHPAMPGHPPPPPPPPAPAAYGYGVPAMMDLAVVRPKATENGEGGSAAVLMRPVGVAVAPANQVARAGIGLESGSDGSSGSDAVDAMTRKRTYEVVPADPMRRVDHITDEREAKRQRRKQSNRESARRSRLRKQAECEDLGTRVNSLTMENMHLRRELSKLQEKYSQLGEERVMLQEQIRSFSGGAAEGRFGVNLTVRGKPTPCREVEGKSRRGMSLTAHIETDVMETSSPVSLVLDDSEGSGLMRRDRDGDALVTRSLWTKSDTIKKTLSLATSLERDSNGKSLMADSGANVLGVSSSTWNRQQRSKLEDSVVATVA